MPIAFLLAAVLAQAAPNAAAAPAPDDIATASSPSTLPKDDYGLVAWCHGAVAGQLELDPIAHADMISIEGKAKVAARAKSDAEMEKDRRAYLHEYERALAAAEKASPTAIHQYGVESEVSGYKLWGATRQKQPIWRMLDWGMWDANDAGCGDAAKRLYNKATLFGEALKGAPADAVVETKAESDAPLPPAFGDHAGAPTIGDEAKTTAADAGAPAAAAAAEAAPTATAPKTAASAPASALVADAPDAATPPAVARPKTVHAKTSAAKTKKAKAVATPTITTAPTAAPADAAPAASTSPDAAPAQPNSEPMRGPQT